MKKFIGVEGILREINATPAQVCDHLLYFFAHELSLDMVKLEQFIEMYHPKKYDCEASLRDNCESAFGKEIAEQIEYSLSYGDEERKR